LTCTFQKVHLTMDEKKTFIQNGKSPQKNIFRGDPTRTSEKIQSAMDEKNCSLKLEINTIIIFKMRKIRNLMNMFISLWMTKNVHFYKKIGLAYEMNTYQEILKKNNFYPMGSEKKNCW